MYLVFKKTDLLVAMEPWQVRYLSDQLTREYQYTLLGMWSDPILPYIQDPYGSGDAYFDKCFGYIKDSVDGLAQRIKAAA